MKLQIRNIKKLLSQLPLPFWVSFYIFLLLITLPVLAYIGNFGNAAPGSLTVTINQKSGTADPNPSYTSVFTVQFSEAIDRATFTAPDITLAGTAPGQQVQSITEAGSFNKTTYEVRIQATAAGTITPSIAQELITAENGANGTNQASTSSDNSVTYNGDWAPGEFVMTVKTDNPGSTASNQFQIPTTGGIYNYNVDCNADGLNDLNGQTGDATCTYGGAGTYALKITGTFPRIYFGNYGGDARKVLTVEQWGTNPWTSMDAAFPLASNMQVPAIDAPNLTVATNISQMFFGATALNSNLNHWDVSNIQEMFAVFSGAPAFNQPLNSWDVSSVTNMQSLFYGATSFNQPLDNWDVGLVDNTYYMFANAPAFNQPLNNWNVSSVTAMTYMFSGATSFNQPLDNWDVSGVTEMQNMFANATSFNQPLAAWDVSSVINMTGMFINATSFNQPLNNWTTSSLGNAEEMFSGATAFDQSLSNWDMADVVYLLAMFSNGSGLSAANYDATLIGWSQQALLNNVNFGAGASTYCSASSARQQIIDTYNWTINDGGQNCPSPSEPFIFRVKTDNGGPGPNTDTEFVIPTGTYTYNYNVDCNNDGTPEHTNQTGDVTCSYGSPGEYNIAISGDFPHFAGENSGQYLKIIDVIQWGDIEWQDMSYMFEDARNLESFSATDIPNLTNVTDMSGIFSGAEAFNDDISAWDVSTITDMSNIFSGASAFNQPLSNWDVASVVSFQGAFDRATSFNQPLSNWDTSSASNMTAMFYSAESFNQNINSWNVSSVTDMQAMFNRAISFNQPLDNWNTSSVTSMSSMFSDAITFNQNINSWNVSNVTDMHYMFGDEYADSPLVFNQPLDNWNTSSVTNMQEMFINATSFNQDISTWDVSNVTNMGSMFMFATSFNQTLNNWDVSSVSNMSGMFAGASSFDQLIDNWNTSNVTNMSFMFAAASSFDRSLAGWDVSNVADMTYMFGDAGGQAPGTSGLSTVNYDATLISWSQQNLEGFVTFDAGTSKYCNSEIQRQTIIDDKFWTINDTGKDCSPNVTTQPATQVTIDSATLNGTSSGIGITQRGFEYGTSESYGTNIVDTEARNHVFSSAITMPSGVSPEDIDIDSNGNIYVATGLGNQIRKYDSSGNFVTSWTGFESGDGWGPGFEIANGVHVDINDDVYVADVMHNRVQKFDSNGNFILQISGPSRFGGSGDGEFNYPRRVAGDNTGNIYVMDSGNNRIQKFTSSGVFISKWDAVGSGNGEFIQPRGMAFDAGGNIYVADTGNNRIQKFDSNFSFLDSWQTDTGPIDVAVDSQGNIYVGAGTRQVQKFDSQGNLLTEWGNPAGPNASVGDEVLGYVRGLVLDNQGRLLVASDGSFGGPESAIRLLDMPSIGATLGGLACNTTYHYRAYATNSNGTGYGEDETFTTDVCDNGLAAPQNLTGIPDVMSIAVDWNEVSGATYYILEYKESSSGTWTQYSDELVATDAVIPALKPSTSYDIRVQAGDTENNLSEWSDILTISTLPQQTYTITNCEELQAIFIDRDTLELGDPTGRYVLQNDIDCSETIDWTWNEAFSVDENIDMPTRGFFPMWCSCESGQPFAGTLDGQGYKVTNLFQANPLQGFLKDGIATVGGLFGSISNAEITDIHLEDTVILKDIWFENEFSFGVGGLTATGYDSNISGSSVSGLIDIARPVAPDGSAALIAAGGIVGGGAAEFWSLGSINNTVTKTYADVTIKMNSDEDLEFSGWEPEDGEWGEGDNFIPGMPDGVRSLSMFGGLMADASGGSISNTYSLGSVEITSNTPLTQQHSGIIAGGLVGGGFGFYGDNLVTITNSYSATSINLNESNRADVVGGLNGWSDGSIQNSFSAGIVAGNETAVPDGGLLGAILTYEGSQVASLTNNFYDQTRSTKSACVGTVIEYIIGESTDSTSPPDVLPQNCSAVNPSNSQPTYFFNNKTNPPLNQWNFASIWKTTCQYPNFVGASGCTPNNPGGGGNPTDPEDPTDPTDPENPGGSGGGGGTTTPPTTPNSPTDSSGNPAIPPVGSDRPLTTNLFVQGATLGPLQRLVESIPGSVARSIPWTLLLLLIALSLYYLYMAYLEEERRKALRTLIARFKSTQAARASYLDITSHYVNTPLSVMQGTVQVLASKKAINEELNMAATTQLDKLSKAVQSLLAQAQQTSTSQTAVVSALERTTITSIIGKPYVWVPLAVSYTLAFLANVIFIQADKYEPSVINIAAQIGVAIVGLLAIVSSVYYWQRMKQAKRLMSEQVELEKQYAYQQAEFIGQAYESLSADLTALNVLGKTIVEQPQGKSFAEALTKLERTLFKLETVGQLARNVPGQTWQTNVNQAIEAALTEVRQAADAKQVSITTQVEPHLIANIGEAGLVHVVRAPLMNAIQFSSPGSQVAFTAVPADNNIVLTTQDHGPGIDKATQDKLFQPFSRSATEQFNYEGMGLDLYLTRVILEQYGGTITLNSTVGEGTRVGVTLPPIT